MYVFRYDVLSFTEEIDKVLLRETALKLGLEKLVTLVSENMDTEMSQERNAMADWIRLNVGGTIFETSRSTLTSDSDSILSRMFEPNSNLPPATITKDGVYQIDACPRSFEVVLNWLRYRTLILGDHKVEDVFPIVDYFGLGELRRRLETAKEEQEAEDKKMTSAIETSTDKLEEVLQHIECELTNMNEKLEDFGKEVSPFLNCQFYPWL